MRNNALIAAVTLIALAACSPQGEPAATTAAAETPAAPAAMADMPMPAATTPAGPVTSSGKITAIDAAAGTVTLDHAAIPEVKWEAMTMAFTVTDPAFLRDLKIGDTVSFDLKSASEPTKISRISKQ